MWIGAVVLRTAEDRVESFLFPGRPRLTGLAGLADLAVLGLFWEGWAGPGVPGWLGCAGLGLAWPAVLGCSSRLGCPGWASFPRRPNGDGRISGVVG